MLSVKETFAKVFILYNLFDTTKRLKQQTT